MAHMHFRRTVYKSGGRQAAGRLAYITRQPMREQAGQQIQYISQGREDCLFTRSRNLPVWCAGNPQTYFAAAERYEGAGWVAFEELKISLPVDLSHRQNMTLMQDLVDAIAGDRLPITYAFHAPRTLDETQEQPHLHLILSRRQTDDIDRGPERHFRKHNAAHPARGGAKKDTAFAERLAQRHLRVLVSDVINVHLDQAGVEERVHPGTLRERGIDRKPEPKLLPSESHAYREHGTISETMQEVLTIRAERQQTRASEQANAREYWEARKGTLGITDDMDRPTQLAAVCEARALVRDQAPTRTVAQGYAGVEQDERTLGDLAGEVSMQAQADAQVLWRGVQDLSDAWQLIPLGRIRVQQTRSTAQEIWRDAQDEQRLRDVGSEAADDAWRDAVLLWAEEQGARALRDVGWEAVQEARDEGHEALDAAWQARWQRLAQAQAWPNLAQDLEALARQLDALDEEEGGTGRVRVQLWDRERDQSWGF